MPGRLAFGMIAAGIIALMPAARHPTHTPAVAPDLAARIGVMERKAALLSESLAEVEERYAADVAPIEAELLKRARDPKLATAAAWAIVREADARHLSPRLLAEVLKLENPWLVSDTVSFAGAVGWFQIMPLHTADGTHPCGPELTDGNTSACYGADILREYIGRALSEALHTALLRYNGCVRTPGCRSYADTIMARLEEGA